MKKIILVDLNTRRFHDGKLINITYNFGWEEGHSVSGYVHSAFNYEAGDVYGWPADNITPEELDEWYEKGQRTFVVVRGKYAETIVKIEIKEDEEYWQKCRDRVLLAKAERIKEKKVDLLDDLLGCMGQNSEETVEDYREELGYIRDEISTEEKKP